MCLTIPAKVVAVKETASGSPMTEITVLASGRTRDIKALDLPGLSPGDWVLCAYDTAVRAISPADAREISDLLEPTRHIDASSLDPAFIDALKGHATRGLTKEKIIRLLKTEDQRELTALFSEANTVRQAHLKDFFCIHGIVEFSNHCIRDCFYCGLRKDSRDVKRYRMTPDEIVETVSDAVNGRGYKLIVLQSGDDFHYTDGTLADIVRGIKKKCRAFIFISVGERGLECYRKMKEAGASGVLFRFETSNKKVYDSIHPGQSHERRLELLRAMKGLGYYAASGFLIGLPGQTVDDIAGDIILMKELGVNMVSAGPFIPCGGTPLAGCPAGSAAMTLKVIAVSRLLMPKAKIPVTTALETIENAEGRRLGLSSGANSLMFNLTPERYRGDYRIYPGKYHGSTGVWERYGLFKEALSYRMLEKKMFEAFEAGKP
ncbi:MAG: [FeFe] hydrogenase H-cluster radical SAM maturase HydE [Deltaproteobacteria bacterium]|nr:[FeFe] hydrogenase H-cluster radical SAM maturase HydE [Deltaproteobacteria bacterium]